MVHVYGLNLFIMRMLHNFRVLDLNLKLGLQEALSIEVELPTKPLGMKSRPKSKSRGWPFGAFQEFGGSPSNKDHSILGPVLGPLFMEPPIWAALVCGARGV